VLQPGLKLPGHLYAKSGRVLKRAGSVLTEDHIELLSKEPLMIDGSWGLDGSGEPVEQLVDNIEADKTGANRRHYPRHQWEAPLKIKLEQHLDGEPATKQISVQASDLSRAGFSFIYHSNIPNESVVHVRFDDLPRSPQVTGMVRNSVQLDDGSYRVGIQFVATERAQ